MQDFDIVGVESTPELDKSARMLQIESGNIGQI